MVRYHQDIRGHVEHNAHEIEVDVEQDGQTLDLTGASAQYILKASDATDDIDAILNKTGQQGVSENAIEFTDPLNGQLVVHIGTNELSGAVDWTTATRNEAGVYAKELWHRLDVTDASGRLVTGFFGTFEVVRR